MFVPTGTLINVAAIICGTCVGLRLGHRLPARFKETTLTVNGLVTLALGINMAGATHNFLLMLAAVVIGGLLGEWGRLQEALQRFGQWLEAKAAGVPLAAAVSCQCESPTALAAQQPAASGTNGANVALAFVTASLIFCVGPMTVLGSLQDGLRGDYQLLAIKSLLDMLTSLTLAATLGWGIGLSIITVIFLQGGLSLLAHLLGQSATGLLAGHVMAGAGKIELGAAMVDEMSAAGGIMLLGSGLLLLDLKRIRIANLLPALALAPGFVLVLYKLGLPLAPFK